jgi:hypothetical protein
LTEDVSSGWLISGFTREPQASGMLVSGRKLTNIGTEKWFWELL